MGSLFTEFRCVCGQLLFRGFLNDSFIEIKCKRCKKINHITGTDANHVSETYFLLYDSEGNIVDASSTGQTILGHVREDLIGQRLGATALHAGGEFQTNFWDKAYTARFDPLVVETLHQHKNGEQVHVRERIKFQQIDNKQYALVSHEVIRKEGLLLSPQAVPFGKIDPSGPMAKINVEGALTYVNPMFGNELMYDSVYMLGKSFFDFCSEEIVTNLRRHFELMLSSHKSFCVPRLALITRDHKIIRLNLSFIAMYYSDNTLSGFMIVDTSVLSVDLIKVSSWKEVP